MANDNDNGGKAAKLVPVRVLTRHPVDGKWYEPDTVLELEPSVVKGLVAIGVVDPHPDAVKYARKLAAERETVAKADAALEG